MEIKAEEHIGLVMRVVKPYAAAMKTAIMDSEVFSDGCIGLMKAVEAYDPQLGFQFSTFATTCIETAVRDGFRQRRRRKERHYKDGSIVKMHVSSKCAELSHVPDETLSLAIMTENETRLRSAIDALPERHRAIIELRLEGHGLKEVGEIMGYSKQRAEQVEKMARRAIVDILTGDGNRLPVDNI